MSVIGVCLSVIRENKVDHLLTTVLISSDSVANFSQHMAETSAKNASSLTFFVFPVLILLWSFSTALFKFSDAVGHQIITH